MIISTKTKKNMQNKVKHKKKPEPKLKKTTGAMEKFI